MVGAVFPHCYLTWGQTMVELMKIMATSFKSSPARTATLSPRSPPKQATTNPHVCWTLLGESESVSCGVTAPFSWVLMHKVLFVPSKSLFPQSCVSSGSMVWFMATSSKRAYAISRTLHPESLPCGRPLLSHTSSGDTQTQLSSLGSQGPGAHKVGLSPLSISGRNSVWF